MGGTAVLINKDHSVIALENVEREVCEGLVSHGDCEEMHCTINEKEIQFASISKVLWYEEMIDWDYGY